MQSSNERQYFQSTLHRQRHCDRGRQRQVPQAEEGPGCLGLAALFRNVDEGECQGQRVLYPNECITWLAMRDVPSGRLPGCRMLNRHGMTCVSRATGELRFGLPRLNFCRSEAVVIDSLQTSFRSSFRPLEARGWMRPPAEVLDDRQQTREFAIINELSAAMKRAAFCGPASPQSWMPSPYLGFAAATEPELFAATHSMEARRSFRKDLACRLPLSVPTRTRYLGATGRDGCLVRHTFEDVAGGYRVVTLPAAAQILARHKQMLKAGEVWCLAVPEVPRTRNQRDRSDHFPTLAEACGGHCLVSPLERAWFEAQGLLLQSCPGVVLFPASLVAKTVHKIPPHCLWWDLGTADPYITNARNLDAAVFPPIPLARWDALRMGLQDIDIDADVGENRLIRRSLQRNHGMRPISSSPQDAINRNRGKSTIGVSARRRRGLDHESRGRSEKRGKGVVTAPNVVRVQLGAPSHRLAPCY